MLKTLATHAARPWHTDTRLERQRWRRRSRSSATWRIRPGRSRPHGGGRPKRTTAAAPRGGCQRRLIGRSDGGCARRGGAAGAAGAHGADPGGALCSPAVARVGRSCERVRQAWRLARTRACRLAHLARGWLIGKHVGIVATTQPERGHLASQTFFWGLASPRHRERRGGGGEWSPTHRPATSRLPLRSFYLLLD